MQNSLLWLHADYHVLAICYLPNLISSHSPPHQKCLHKTFVHAFSSAWEILSRLTPHSSTHNSDVGNRVLSSHFMKCMLLFTFPFAS